MTPVLKVNPRKRPYFEKEDNRRSRARYGIKESFRYRSFEGDVYSQWSSGKTLNMSAQGILANFSEPLSAGTKVEMQMDWPGAYFDRQMVRLHLTASVIRTDQQGMALRILTHRFLDIKPQLKLATSNREGRYVTSNVRQRTYPQFAESQPA